LHHQHGPERTKIEADSILVVVRRKCELIDTTFLNAAGGNKKEYNITRLPLSRHCYIEKNAFADIS
jgi:hypothetical protein